jgi:hypothetical protein
VAGTGSVPASGTSSPVAGPSPAAGPGGGCRCGWVRVNRSLSSTARSSSTRR